MAETEQREDSETDERDGSEATEEDTTAPGDWERKPADEEDLRHDDGSEPLAEPADEGDDDLAEQEAGDVSAGDDEGFDRPDPPDEAGLEDSGDCARAPCRAAPSGLRGKDAGRRRADALAARDGGLHRDLLRRVLRPLGVTWKPRHLPGHPRRHRARPGSDEAPRRSRADRRRRLPGGPARC